MSYSTVTIQIQAYSKPSSMIHEWPQIYLHNRIYIFCLFNAVCAPPRRAGLKRTWFKKKIQKIIYFPPALIKNIKKENVTLRHIFRSVLLVHAQIFHSLNRPFHRLLTILHKLHMNQCRKGAPMITKRANLKTVSFQSLQHPSARATHSGTTSKEI